MYVYVYIYIYRREENIKMIFRKWDVVIWTGSSWLRIGTGGLHL
jgi:hypothetical protein